MKRYGKLIVLAIVLVMLIATIGVTSVFASGDMEGKLVVIHTNDSHSRIDENLGFATVAALKEDYAARGADVIVMDAGDTLHGFPVANLTYGNNIVDILNAVGYNYMTLGNHDFNYGSERALAIAGKTTSITDAVTFGGKILVSNIKNTESGELVFDANDIIEIGGKKVGIFGLATPETVYKSHPDNTAGLTFVDPSVAAAEQVEFLKTQGCTYIIALAHLGLDESSTVNRSSEVAANVEGINLIVDGHSHSVLETGMLVNSTLIVSTGEYIQNVGVVVIDGETTTASLATTKLENEAVTNLINEKKAITNELMQVVVGTTSVDLVGERAFVRTSETNLGNLAADAMRYVSGADVAFTNGGGIRASIGAGEITKEMLFTVFPFGNYVVSKYLPVTNILAALELGVQSYPSASGGFPQIAGMEFTFDASLPAGNRVLSLAIGGAPVYYMGAWLVDETTEFLFATNNFTAAGGDGYEMIGSGSIHGEFGALEEVMIAYIEYLSDNDDGISTANYEFTENRIQSVNIVDQFGINAYGEIVLYFNNGATLNLGELRGPQGEPGADGVDGVDGVDGTNGIDGIDGKDGKDGEDGATVSCASIGGFGSFGGGIGAVLVLLATAIIVTVISKRKALTK